MNKYPNEQRLLKNSNKKKVIILGHIDGYGGAQTAFRELINFVKREEYLIKIIVITDRNKNDTELTNQNILGRIIHHDSSLFNFKKWRDLLLISFRVWLTKPDIFISVGLSNSANFISRFLGIKCFKIGQDFIANRFPDDAIWNSSRHFLNGIALQSPSMLNYWEDLGIDLTGVNWLPCFPEQPAKGVLCSVERTIPGKVRLSYFGRLAGNKGLSLLFHAIAESTISQHITLDLWGTGPEEPFLKKLAIDLKIDEKIRFLGKYPANEEGARVMVSYDALVLCSTETEGLPLILLEAMAYGLPFLATNIGAIRDCCVDNPDVVLVEPTQNHINLGLSILCKRIESGNFSPSRLQNYYLRNFSHEVMSARWRSCFDDPHFFFYGD